MTPNVENLGPCSACGGRLFPFILCESCGAATILREARQLENQATCPECGARNPWQLICDQCHSRFRAPPPEEAPPTANLETKPETVAAPARRPKRRINGESDPASLVHLLKVLGLDPSRAQALIDRGYDALWKIARASVDELARIPEVGPVAARKMLASLHLIKYAPPRRTKEQIAQDEYECPLCGCITSAFAPACLECGAAFDEEEMDEAIREQFATEGDAALLAFYDARLGEKPENADLLYARGLLLQTMGRTDEAIESLDRAAAAAPDERKIRVAQLRIQAKELRKPDAAEKLRSTASALLDDVAWDQEVARLDQLISESEPACPSCGSTVPGNVALCPSCGARLAGAPPEPAAKRSATGAPELDILVDDLLVGELEQSLTPEELELTKAAVLDWLIEELEETMGVDATIKAATEKREETKAAAEPSPVPPAVGFLSGWMRGSKGLVSGARPKTATRGAGKVNGLVNGRGRVNGLVNGLGRTNGLVNGVGRVNGLVTPTGRVNGLMGEQGRVNGTIGTRSARAGRKEIRVSAPSKRVRYAAIGAATLFAILVAGFLFIPISGPAPPIAIDGSFADWASVPKFDAATVASDPYVSIVNYASLVDGNSLYLFASTRGGMFGDSSAYDGVYFLIDADGNPSTGYQFGGIGAEGVVEVFGANNTVAGARLYGFPTNSERNWSQRQPLGSPSAAASVQGVEAQVSIYDLTGFDPAQFRIAVFADDFAGISSRSLAPLTPNGSVLVELLPLASVVSPTTTSWFTIRVHALGLPVGASWGVSSFIYNATPGLTVFLSTGSMTLTQAQPNATITASVFASGIPPGNAVQIDVTNATAPVPVVIRGGPIRAYVVAPLSTVRIDGLFADWVGRDQADSDPVPVQNPDVNILRYGAAVNTSAAYFHVAVAGDLMAGRVPDRFIRLPPEQGGNGSGGPPIPLPRRTGEDILRVYVDLNSTDAVGLPVDGIYADYNLEVRGVAGRITSQNLYAWTGSWSPIPSSGVALAKNATDVEGSIVVGPTTNTTRMVFEATDWSSGADWTVGVGAPSFAPSSQFAVTTHSLARPRTNGFGGSTFYLQSVGPLITPGDCPLPIKGLNTTQGILGTSITLSSGSKPCFFTDPASSPETISAGLWAASLDLSASSGTVLNVTFAVTGQDGTSATPICGTNTNTTGGPNKLFSCTGGDVNISTNQRIRLQVAYVSGPSIDLSCDGSAASENSSITVPVPEFGEMAAPAAATVVLLLLLTYRRRSRPR